MAIWIILAAAGATILILAALGVLAYEVIARAWNDFLTDFQIERHRFPVLVMGINKPDTLLKLFI